MSEFGVTVIITSYNLEKYISKCLDELKSQTIQNFNILLVDDCSLDNTVRVAEEYKDFFADRFHIISTPRNLGLPGLVRNYALESGLVNGDYVLFLDGDDRIKVNMLEVLYRAALVNNADVVICAYDRFYEGDNKAFSVEMKGFRNKVLLFPANTPDIMFVNTSPWNKLWKIEVIKGLAFPSIKVGEEVSFNYRAYRRSKIIFFVEEVLIHYIVRDASVISNTEEKAIDLFRIDLESLYLEEKDDDRKKIVEMLIFLHIGLSMSLRAADNNKIDLRDYVAATKKYFATKHNLFKGNEWLRLKALKRYGLKGVAIWLALVAYRMNIFFPMLSVYRRLGLQIKF